MLLFDFDPNSVVEVFAVIGSIVIIIISILILIFAFYRLLRGTTGYKYSEINPQQKKERRAKFSIIIIWFIVFFAIGANILYFSVFKW